MLTPTADAASLPPSSPTLIHPLPRTAPRCLSMRASRSRHTLSAPAPTLPRLTTAPFPSHPHALAHACPLLQALPVLLAIRGCERM
eukprot:596996-Rhodomonas_salina.1